MVISCCLFFFTVDILQRLQIRSTSVRAKQEVKLMANGAWASLPAEGSTKGVCGRAGEGFCEKSPQPAGVFLKEEPSFCSDQSPFDNGNNYILFATLGVSQASWDGAGEMPG